MNMVYEMQMFLKKIKRMMNEKKMGGEERVVYVVLWFFFCEINLKFVVV